MPSAANSRKFDSSPNGFDLGTVSAPRGGGQGKGRISACSRKGKFRFR